jgi:uncharacterized protein (DUF2236 family)
VDTNAATELVRNQLSRAIRHAIAGDRQPVRDISEPIVGDRGLFGPESVTWRIHADASMLVGGVRALFLQTMHPLAMAGIAEHSAYKGDPTGRLWRTSEYVGTVTFGTTEQATAAVAMVKRVHESVVGISPDGRPYAANDPHLLGWVHHTLVDSFLRAYKRYGKSPLSDDDANRYVYEQSLLADLFGANDPAPARSTAELREWLRGIRPELRAGRQAREATRFLLLPPLPLASRPAYALISSAAVGLLPRWIQRALWIPIVPTADMLAIRPATRALTNIVGWALSAPTTSQSSPTQPH